MERLGVQSEEGHNDTIQSGHGLPYELEYSDGETGDPFIDSMVAYTREERAVMMARRAAIAAGAEEEED